MHLLLHNMRFLSWIHVFPLFQCRIIIQLLSQSSHAFFWMKKNLYKQWNLFRNWCEKKQRQNFNFYAIEISWFACIHYNENIAAEYNLCMCSMFNLRFWKKSCKLLKLNRVFKHNITINGVLLFDIINSN